MKKILLFMLLGLFLFTACSSDSDKAASDETLKVFNVEDLMSDDFEYKEGNKVTVEGLCLHVCSHSGKKMFISGENTDNRLQIFTGDVIPAFDKKFEGSKLRVVGILDEERIDMNYIKEWESELAAETESDGGHSCEFEESMKKIDYYRDRVKNSKRGYISVFTMTGMEVKEI